MRRIPLQPYRQGCHFYAKICLKKASKKNVNNVNIQILDDKKLTFIIC